MGGHQSSQDSEHTKQVTGNSLFENVPDDLIIEILVHVPAKDIINNCVLVSKYFRNIISSQTLWRMKCEREGKFIPGKTPVPNDFKKLFFFAPYTRNLIRNPCAAEGLKYWDVVKNGGDRFKVECERCGSQKISETDMPNEWTKTPIQQWATSYGACEKKQIIDLIQEGVDPIILDETKPKIYISEWFAARFDCACHYELSVKLLSKENIIIDEFKFSDDIPQWTSGQWTKVEHTFVNYKPGVRYIEFCHLGKDGQFWAGHYGSKFTLSTVRFIF